MRQLDRGVGRHRYNNSDDRPSDRVAARSYQTLESAYKVKMHIYYDLRIWGRGSLSSNFWGGV